MGRNIPSIRKKIDEIVEDVSHLAKFIRDPEIRENLEKIVEKWREESGAISHSRNPLIYFNLLLLTLADVSSKVEKLSKKLNEIEKLILDKD